MSLAPPAPPRVVYDCMVYLQAAMSGRGPAARCIDLVEQGLVQLLVSEEILAEVGDVLTRPSIRRKRPSLTPEVVVQLLAHWRQLAIVIEPVPARFSYARDSKDEPYLNLALAGAATYLVSRDDDLLDLQSAGSSEGTALRDLSPSLLILDPVSFLRTLEELFPDLVRRPS